MNKLNGKIEGITSGSPYASYEISLATGDSMAAIAPSFSGRVCHKAGDTVEIFFDELDVVLAKSFSGETTIKKKFMGVVKRVESDAATTRVVLDYKGTLVAALVRTSSWQALGFTVGDDVNWFIKATRVNVGIL
ncbi:MAG: hypothetical protein EHM79_13530 [Geobacter sp.]|nr:MAG: hypothetical protein EHM79_13530 [Geobacter sp.]